MRLLSPIIAATLVSACTPPALACFRPGTELPVLSASASPLARALAEGHVDRAKALLGTDPSLARHGEILAFAVAGCSDAGVKLALDNGAPVDGVGDGLPLVLALRAESDSMARLLLKRGASPNPRGAPTLPMRTVIGLNEPERVALLIGAGADLEARERTGRRALHIALDQERFGIAAQLLDAGADPFAIDASGANLGSSALAPAVTSDSKEVSAQQALRARLHTLGWPEPVPDARSVARRAIEGAWPPAGVRAAPVPPEVLTLIRERQRPR